MSRIADGYACGGGTLGFLTAKDRAKQRWCCYGEAEYGPDGCTCWEPSYDMEQVAPILGLPVGTRATRCHDCAFRPDSPERARGDELEGLGNFRCHQGVRRVTSWRHPDGRVRPGDPADYEPPMIGGQGFKADGTTMDICAGWAQAQRQAERMIGAEDAVAQ